jgi:uncharacterized protein (DUF3084 family)
MTTRIDMLSFLKRFTNPTAGVTAALDTLRGEINAVHGELGQAKADAARVRQGLAAELERARADITSARQELAAVRQEVTKARQESLAASQSPTSSVELDERVAVLERMIISKYDTASSSRRGNVISDLRTKEFGNKVQLRSTDVTTW